MKLLCFFIFVFFLFYLPSCLPKGDCPPNITYHLPTQISPIRDTFQIGDTLFLTMEFPKSLKADELSDSTIFEDFDFQLLFYTIRRDVYHELTFNTLDLTDIIGSSTPRFYGEFQDYLLHLVYDGVMYQYSAILVLKEKGTFESRLVSRYDDRRNPAMYEGKCSHKPTDFRCVINTSDPVDNNVDLIKPYDSLGNFERFFVRRGSFAFVVQ